MPPHKKIYDLIADVLTYPKQDYKERVERCKISLQNYDPPMTGSELSGHPKTDAASLFSSFASFVNEKSTHELEEFYTQTFDFHPVTCLEIGWHLFGESYDRGAFLVRMRELLRQHRIEETSELPDHITHVLAVLARMEETEASDFVRTQLLKAINKMLDGFEGNDNPYKNVLRTLKSLLTQQYPENRKNAFEASESDT